MSWLRRIFLCGFLDRHRNARCESLGWVPLFPIRCDTCGELFYQTPRRPPSTPERKAGT